ncbi:MAG: hypothetical protein ABIJ31_00590 [Pseudomonadota bacterium]
MKSADNHPKYEENKPLERDQAYCAAFSEVPGSGKFIILSEFWGLKSLVPQLSVIEPSFHYVPLDARDRAPVNLSQKMDLTLLYAVITMYYKSTHKYRRLK